MDKKEYKECERRLIIKVVELSAEKAELKKKSLIGAITGEVGVRIMEVLLLETTTEAL